MVCGATRRQNPGIDQMVEWPGPVSKAGGRADRFCHIVLGFGDRLREGLTGTKQGGNRRREGASGSMRVASLDPLTREERPAPSIEEQVTGVIREMTAFEQHRWSRSIRPLSRQFVNLGSRPLSLLQRPHSSPRQSFGFCQVGRNERRQGQQVRDQFADGPVINQIKAARRSNDWIDDHLSKLVSGNGRCGHPVSEVIAAIP
jgi:hypothetical protein